MTDIMSMKRSDIAFDPEEVEELALVYDDIRFATKVHGVDRHPDLEIAKCVVELAQRGATDRQTIRACIFAAFRLNRL
jgi:hypothetical protein